MDARLPSGLEVAALMRAVQAEGGFATVIARGDPDSGPIMLILLENGGRARLYERMPTAQGRAWTCMHTQNDADFHAFNEIVERRRARDRDLWIVELDIPQAERFVVEPRARG